MNCVVCAGEVRHSWVVCYRCHNVICLDHWIVTENGIICTLCYASVIAVPEVEVKTDDSRRD